jgi:hypothetical protein
MGCANSKTAAATSTTQPAVIGERPSNVVANKPTLTLPPAPPAPPVAAVPPPVYKPTTAAPNVYKPAVAPSVYKPPAAPTAPKKHESEAKDVTNTPEKPLDINHLDLSGMSPAVAAICQDSIHLINAMDQHILVCQKTGKYEQALEYHIKVLGPREDKFGRDHPIISDSFMNIGLCKIGQGRLNECMDCFNLVLKIRQSKLGNDDPETAECKAKVGLGFAAQKQYENALVYYYQAEITLEKTVGPNHVYSYGLYINMADCFRAQSEYTDALEYYNKAQDMALVVFGGRSVQVSKGRILMGQTKLEARDISGALELCRQAHKTDLVVRPTEINTINTGILIQQIERSVNNARAEQQERGIPNGVGSTALSQ